MSFSKAKIHRFNDEKPCAPPPGAYNPETVDKSVGPIIHKTERFSDNHKLMIHASSTDSVNSLSSERGTSSTGGFATFKTPKIPSTYRAISRTDVRRKEDVSLSKAASTDYINKKSSHHEREMNPLKYTLHMLQDELAIEKNKNQRFLAELNQLRETTSETETFSEWLIQTVSQKNEFIDLLTEKCHALQRLSVQGFESYQSYVKNMCSILEAHYTSSSETDWELTNLIKRYEKLVAEYEQDIESLFIFLVDLQQKHNSMTFDKGFLDDSLEQCNLLLETLKETGGGRKRYEMIILEMQKVIDVLKGRVRESDEEVLRISGVMDTMNQEKAKLRSVIRNKEEEIARMRDVVDSVRKKFFHEVHHTENNLLILIDDFKEKANVEKNIYEADLNRKDSIISDLLNIKNDLELQLQESLDQIEILKCREENLQKTFDQVQSDLRDRCAMFEKSYKECCEKLLDLERTYESGISQPKTKPYQLYSRNDPMNKHSELVRKIVDSLIQNKLLSNDVVDRFDDIGDPEESMILLQELLMNNFARERSDECAFLRRLIDAVSVSFLKCVNEISTLKNDFTRLRDDFIEKCDECGQLTRLLQLSEKNVENSEKKTTELELRRSELEAKLKEQENQIADLECDNVNLRQQLAFETNAKESELVLERSSVTDGKQMNQTSGLENALEVERAKNEALEKRVAKLEALVGPYRSILEKFEAEKKSTAKNDDKVVQKNSKRLTQRNQELKSKIAVLQPKKNVQESIRKNGVLKEGKENHVITKNNETFELKRTTPVDVSMNATYVVTSPKVSRI